MVMQGSPTPDLTSARRLLIGVIALGLLLVAVFTTVAFLASSADKPVLTQNGDVAPEAGAALKDPPPPPDSRLEPVTSSAPSNTVTSTSPTFGRDGVTVVTPPLPVSSVDLASPTADEKSKPHTTPAGQARKGHSTAHHSRTAGRHSRPPRFAAAVKKFFASLLR